MKKRILVGHLVVLCLLTTLAPLAFSAPGTTVSVGSATAGEGETAVVPLMIESVTNLGGASINLTYNASVVNVTSVSDSDFDSAPNLNTRGPGWVLLEGGQYETGLNDDVKLCDATLEAIGNKGDTSPLNLNDVTLEDMAMQPITVDEVLNGTFTIQEDNTAPIVEKSYTEPIIIPEDTDGVPLWGEMVTIDATDGSAISTVTVNLSAMGGSPITNVSNAGNYSDGTFWCVFNATNASVGTAEWNATSGTYEPYYLPVNATDIYGNSNTSVSINLIVMKNGDVQPYDGDGEVDFTHDALYLVRHTKGVPGYVDIRDNIADVTGDGTIDFTHDALYLVRHTKGVPGYEVLH